MESRTYAAVVGAKENTSAVEKLKSATRVAVKAPSVVVVVKLLSAEATKVKSRMPKSWFPF